MIFRYCGSFLAGYGIFCFSLCSFFLIFFSFNKGTWSQLNPFCTCFYTFLDGTRGHDLGGTVSTTTALPREGTAGSCQGLQHGWEVGETEEGRGGPHSVHCAALPCLESQVVTGSWRFQSSDELDGSGHPSKRSGLMSGQSAPCGYPGSTSTGSLASLSVLHSGLVSSSQHHSPGTEATWSCQPIIHS